jgi:carotenoid 1,2-hydratase
MLGNVFSPYYAAARRRAAADPQQYCALNVSLYGITGKRWAMTERDRGALQRSASVLKIGPSALHWDGASLLVEIDEIAVPLPRRIRGRIRLTPERIFDANWNLDAEGRHRWRPLAPRAHLDVQLEQPHLEWQGHGYLDANDGDEPLESRFRKWNWSRGSDVDSTVVFYDVLGSDGSERSIALRFGADPSPVPTAAPDRAKLLQTLWRLERETRSDPPAAAQVLQTLEDGPFYARSLVQTQLAGRPIKAMHESLSLDRFSARWVQSLLPFRMPRRRS